MLLFPFQVGKEERGVRKSLWKSEMEKFWRKCFESHALIFHEAFEDSLLLLLIGSTCGGRMFHGFQWGVYSCRPLRHGTLIFIHTYTQTYIWFYKMGLLPSKPISTPSRLTANDVGPNLKIKLLFLYILFEAQMLRHFTVGNLTKPCMLKQCCTFM